MENLISPWPVIKQRYAKYSAFTRRILRVLEFLISIIAVHVNFTVFVRVYLTLRKGLCAAAGEGVRGNKKKEREKERCTQLHTIIGRVSFDRGTRHATLALGHAAENRWLMVCEQKKRRNLFLVRLCARGHRAAPDALISGQRQLAEKKEPRQRRSRFTEILGSYATPQRSRGRLQRVKFTDRFKFTGKFIDDRFSSLSIPFTFITVACAREWAFRSCHWFGGAGSRCVAVFDGDSSKRRYSARSERCIFSSRSMHVARLARFCGSRVRSWAAPLLFVGPLGLND